MKDSSFVATDTGFFLLVGFSPAHKFPQAEFAPYQNTNYEWNPVVCYEICSLMTFYYFFTFFCQNDSVSFTVAFKKKKKKKFEPLLMLSFALLYNEPTLVGKYIYELAIGT